MNLLRRIMGERDMPLSLNEYADWFNYNGNLYQLLGGQTLLGGKEESVGRNYSGLASGAYKQNGTVFACISVRMLLFSEARFQYRQLRGGRPGQLFGTNGLGILEKPWPGGTTRDWLARAMLDVDLAGNHFATIRGVGAKAQVKRMRPDWTSIVVGSFADDEMDASDLDSEVLGYVYHPGGYNSGRPVVPLMASEVCHFAPLPDPEAFYRGTSWLSAVVNEVMADKATTRHKLKFFENGATPNLIVTLDAAIQKEAFDSWVKTFREQEEGLENRYKTVFLGAGMSPTVVGANFRQIDFKATQGAGQTLIAAAAGVPPVIVGLSEGLEAATYSNYAQARRRFADGTMHPLWGNMAGSAARLVPEENGAELWYDHRHIAFLREDEADAAKIIETQTRSIRQLIDSGFDPDTAKQAVVAGDLLQAQHTGLVSVQLQPPGSGEPAANGNQPSEPAPTPDGA